MRLSRRDFLGASLVLGSGWLDALATEGRPPVTLLKTPDDGIQPQAVVDHQGTLHLIYFRGDAAAGDVFYVRRRAGDARFSNPIQVNQHPGSAIAVGSVRGAQLALGENGRVHVAWLGSSKAEPRGPGDATPMLYTRLNDAGTGFEPERNVLQYAKGLDGGGSLAADRAGNVYVTWHGNPLGNGEAHRRVYLAKSVDGGTSFAREVPVSPEGTGACGCCGMRAFADRNGAVYVLYRTATEMIHRDMELLVSRDRGRSFAGRRIARWTLNACPMSTDYLGQAAGPVLAAWETAGQVYYGQIASQTQAAAVAPPGGGGDRKHPVVVRNAKGQTLLAWTEGTGWQKGGSVAWQVFDGAGNTLGPSGRADGVPVWSLVAAYARPDGAFTILY